MTPYRALAQGESPAPSTPHHVSTAGPGLLPTDTRFGPHHLGDLSGAARISTTAAGSGGLAPTLRLELCGVRIDRLSHPQLLHRIEQRLGAGGHAPMALGSVNLDHFHHFGLRASPAAEPSPVAGDDSGTDWVMLIDGAPVARRATTVTGEPWPRLAGADLLPDLLDVAERVGARVGFLGGHEQTVDGLRDTLARRWPQLRVAGFWTPPRSIVDRPDASAVLADTIAATGVDLLVVGLGKPRQERWIDQHGARTGAHVLLAFGAAADFLAGAARRAPRWMRRAGLEWLFRLLQEPVRLSRRYLVEGPFALWSLRRLPAFITYRESPAMLTPSPAAAPERPVRAPSPRW